MSELEKLLAEPDSQNWEKIVANLDATMDEALLQEKIELCAAELEKWEDKYRECPEHWEEDTDSLKYKLLPRVYPFPHETGLIASYIAAEDWDNFPNGKIVCLALHYNRSLNTIVALYSGHETQTEFDHTYKDYILLLRLDSLKSEVVWTRPRPNPELPSKSNFVYLCDDGTVIASFGVEDGAFKRGGEEILVIRNGETILHESVREESNRSISEEDYPVDTMFLMTENQQFLFWLSPSNQLGRVSVKSSFCISRDLDHKYDWMREVNGEVLLGTRFGIVKILDYQDETLEQLFIGEYHPDNASVATFIPIDNPASEVDCSHDIVYWRAAFNFMEIRSIDRKYERDEIAKITFRAFRGHYYFVCYRLKQVGNQVRVAFHPGDPELVFQIVEFPSSRRTSFGKVYDYRLFPFCFGTQPNEIFLHDGVELMRWRYSL